MEAQAHEPLKELEEVRKQLKSDRAAFAAEKKELDHKLAELMLAQAKHDKCIAAKDAEIATLKTQLREALLDADKKDFAELAYEKSQHATTAAALKIAQAQLEAIKAQADRPKKLVWQVKQCFNIKSLDFAELLNDGWEIMWQAGAFEPEGGYVVNANFKRLSELPADPAPDPDAAIAAAEAHLETILPPLDADLLDQPEPEVVYHISGEQKPAIKLGPIGENIRKHGVPATIDVMNAKIGMEISEALASDPATQRLRKAMQKPLLSSVNQPLQ
jgi:hypothetical protein